MFCKNCGNEINDNAVICPHCGVQVGKLPETSNSEVKQSNTIAIVGFILAFFVALAGLICSIIGYNNSKKYNAPYGGLALAGIIISAVSMILGGFISTLLF